MGILRESEVALSRAESIGVSEVGKAGGLGLEGKGGNVTIRPSWLEKIHQWEKALSLYEAYTDQHDDDGVSLLELTGLGSSHPGLGLRVVYKLSDDYVSDYSSLPTSCCCQPLTRSGSTGRERRSSTSATQKFGVTSSARCATLTAPRYSLDRNSGEKDMQNSDVDILCVQWEALEDQFERRDCHKDQRAGGAEHVRSPRRPRPRRSKGALTRHDHMQLTSAG